MITPQDLLNSAKLLAKQELEVDRRNAISRAYYAIFHSLKAVHLKLEPSMAIGNSHERVINFFVDNTNQELRLLGNRAQQAKSYRVASDYRIHQTVSVHDVKAQIRLANKILEDASHILKEAS